MKPYSAAAGEVGRYGVLFNHVKTIARRDLENACRDSNGRRESALSGLPQLDLLILEHPEAEQSQALEQPEVRPTAAQLVQAHFVSPTIRPALLAMLGIQQDRLPPTFPSCCSVPGHRAGRRLPRNFLS